jgi:hypothetical protein
MKKLPPSRGKKPLGFIRIYREKGDSIITSFGLPNRKISGLNSPEAL